MNWAFHLFGSLHTHYHTQKSSQDSDCSWHAYHRRTLSSAALQTFCHAHIKGTVVDHAVHTAQPESECSICLHATAVVQHVYRSTHANILLCVYVTTHWALRGEQSYPYLLMLETHLATQLQYSCPCNHPGLHNQAVGNCGCAILPILTCTGNPFGDHGSKQRRAKQSRLAR